MWTAEASDGTNIWDNNTAAMKNYTNKGSTIDKNFASAASEYFKSV